jgi:hypothetical protein
LIQVKKQSQTAEATLSIGEIAEKAGTKEAGFKLEGVAVLRRQVSVVDRTDRAEVLGGLSPLCAAGSSAWRPSPE